MDDWYYDADGERRGPLTLAQMRQLVQAGAIRRYTLVTPPGAAEPAAAGQCTELVLAPTHDGSILFPKGYSRPAMVALLLGVLSAIPLVGYAGLVVTVLAIRDLRRDHELKGASRAVIGGLLSLLFSVIYTVAFFG